MRIKIRFFIGSDRNEKSEETGNSVNSINDQNALKSLNPNSKKLVDRTTKLQLYIEIKSYLTGVSNTYLHVKTCKTRKINKLFGFEYDPVTLKKIDDDGSDSKHNSDFDFNVYFKFDDSDSDDEYNHKLHERLTRKEMVRIAKLEEKISTKPANDNFDKILIEIHENYIIYFDDFIPQSVINPTISPVIA
ncbi:hypothetical protein C1646_765576 [Rhizophagus diaphanus]|nr:hypothetical protein C1646_765576 [Rhizophagus diaphanus] [Rhizophagus sp. MUCL 43196]